METKMIIRASDNSITAKEGSRTIEGYAIVFGQKSVRMYDWMRGWVYEEYIDKNAISDELLKKSDVKALVDHNRSKLVARSTNGEGTLSLTLDEKGLYFSFEAPETTAGNDLLELVRRGDMRGCSFAFSCDEEKDKWEKTGKVAKCTRMKITGLYDVSVVVDPAYPSTEVTASERSYLERNIFGSKTNEEELEEKEKDATKKREAEGKCRQNIINNILNNSIL